VNGREAGCHTRALSWRRSSVGPVGETQLSKGLGLQCLQAMTAVRKGGLGRQTRWSGARRRGQTGQEKEGCTGRGRRLCRIYRKVLNGRAASRDVSQGSWLWCKSNVTKRGAKFAQPFRAGLRKRRCRAAVLWGQSGKRRAVGVVPQGGQPGTDNVTCRLRRMTSVLEGC
jgi:hypothetical protein